MKKGIKISTAAILAVSALTPVAAFAAESTVTDGIYTSYGQGYYTAADFAKLSPEVKKAIFADAKAALVAGGIAFNLQSDVVLKTDAQIDAVTTTVEQYETEQGVSFDSGNGFGDVVEPGVKVESVMAINETGVEVTVKVADEDRFDQTIEITDNKGNKVEVKPVTIAAGETTAYFEFVKPVEKQEGVWDVAGQKVDFDLAANLQAFVDAGTDQIKLNKALSDLGIENVKVENIKAYADAHADFVAELAEEDKEISVALIQDFINTVNADLISGEESKAIAKKVTDAIKAENDIALKIALEDSAFTRVNADWLDGYKAAISEKIGEDGSVTAVDSVKEIQASINMVNNGKLPFAAALENVVDKKELNDAKELLNTYATPDAEGKQSEDTLEALKTINVQSAVADVLAATTPNTLKARVAALANLVNTEDDTVIDMKDYLDGNGKIYFTEIKEKISDAFVNTNPQKIAEAISKVNSQVNELVSPQDFGVYEAVNGYNVGFKLNDKQAKDVKSVVVSLYKGETLLATATANKLMEKYPTADQLSAPFNVFGNLEYGDTWTYSGWQGEVTDIPTKAIIKVTFKDDKGVSTTENTTVTGDTSIFYLVGVNQASTAAEMSKALVALEATEEGATNFTNLSSTAKLEVAEVVLAERNEIEAGQDQNAKEFTTKDDALGVANQAITDRANFIKSVNDVVTEATVEAPATIAKIKAVLAGEGSLLPEFKKLGTAAQTDAAEAVLNKLQELQDKDPKEVFTSIGQIRTVAGL